MAHSKKSHSGLLSLEDSGPIQMGFWVPNRIWATAKFLVPLRKEIAKKKKANQLKPMRPEVQAFKDWINSHSVYRMWVNVMIKQSDDYVKNLEEKTQKEMQTNGDPLWIESYDSLFEIINEIVSTSPALNTKLMISTPLNCLLAVPMATEAGIALFHDATFNEQFYKVLNAWNNFLKSKESLDKLDIDDPEKPGSWISKAAWEAGVWNQMECDTTAAGYGFDSWNSFFIRKFVPGARPFHDDPKTTVCMGCETTPWQYENNLSLKADFWIKDAHYSLLDILGGQEQWAQLFEGGQLYQGYLAATHYHRWNAPLTGKLVRSWVQPGTYYAQWPEQGKEALAWEGTKSQPYLSHVAARAIFIFKHETCGYVAVVCIGMMDVSTCVIKRNMRVDEGKKPIPVERGDEIGHFEFGGSTYLMIFQKDRVRLADWAVEAEQHQHDEKPTPMGSAIAWAVE
jgi:phosphatidylserine decarboxylase